MSSKFNIYFQRSRFKVFTTCNFVSREHKSPKSLTYHENKWSVLCTTPINITYTNHSRVGKDSNKYIFMFRCKSKMYFALFQFQPFKCILEIYFIIFVFRLNYKAHFLAILKLTKTILITITKVTREQNNFMFNEFR